MLRISLAILLVGFSLPGWSQEKADSVTVDIDTTLVDTTQPIDTIHSYAKRFDPRKALLYAAVLPGSGQIYNKKYWKLPLVWGGFGLLVYSINFYQKTYVKYKKELFITINDPNNLPPSGFSQTQLRSIVDEARRQRDFYLVISGLVYILQIVDAHVDAHLKEFDLNPKLHVKVEPRFIMDTMTGRSSGLALIMKF